MLKNYMRSLYRNFMRNKFYTLFNILGLATGLTAALLILFYLQDELSYDKHYRNHERIYRLESTFILNGNPDKYATFPIPLGPALKEEIPEIIGLARVHLMQEQFFRYGDRKFYENRFAFADSTHFDVFSHEFIRGNPSTCLTEPNSIVLTESTALRYFGDEDPMGKLLTGDDQLGYRVTAVIRDLPANTHLRYDALISISTHPEVYNISKASRYWRVILYTYVLLHENASMESVSEKFQDFYVREMEPLGKKFNVSFELMYSPLKDTHFRQGLIAEQPSGNKAYLVIFSAIAVFILLLASINYMNMATARSASRAKEVGVRKVMGADRMQLIKQFMGESLAMSLAALALAVILVGLFIGDFNEFADKEISFSIRDNLLVFAGIAGVAFLVGIVSGTYPAFYLSSFQPAEVLKGRVSSTGKVSRNLRKVLVTVQFFIAVFMIISSMVVSGQLDFLREKDLGYEKENLVLVQLGKSNMEERMESFRQQLLQNPNILGVTNSTGVPGLLRLIMSMRIEQEEGMTERSVLFMETDYDFCSTYRMEIMQGRDFDRTMGTDSLEAVLINETAAFEFGWLQDPIGKRIHYGYGQDGSGGRMLKVIGVLKDFHFSSLHNAIEPILLFVQETPGDLLTLRLREENQDMTLRFVAETWEEFGAAIPFRYEYMNDRLRDTYYADEQTATVIRVGTLFTIILALLGLLGLSSFVAELKTREVGIRKIHGATVASILYHLYRDFISLFILAFLLAVPVAWWRLSVWLESEFVYFKDLSWTTFIYAGLFSVVLGTLTISFFIIRTARGNPVDAIKYE